MYSHYDHENHVLKVISLADNHHKGSQAPPPIIFDAFSLYSEICNRTVHGIGYLIHHAEVTTVQTIRNLNLHEIIACSIGYSCTSDGCVLQPAQNPEWRMIEIRLSANHLKCKFVNLASLSTDTPSYVTFRVCSSIGFDRINFHVEDDRVTEFCHCRTHVLHTKRTGSVYQLNLERYAFDMDRYDTLQELIIKDTHE